MKTSKKQFGISSIFTLVLTLCIFSTSTFAGDLKKMESKPVELVTSSNFDFLINYLSEDFEEETLTLEDWMLNPETFSETIPEDLAFSNEGSLEVESWMLDVNSFMPEEEEPELALENWMLDVDSFINTNVCQTKNFALK